MAVWCGYFAILLVKVGLAVAYVRRRGDTSVATGETTVLIPIASGDPELEAILRSNLQTAPATARFLFLIDEGDAEGQRIADALQGESPIGRLEVAVCPPPHANENPKTTKLVIGLDRVQTEYVAVLDDDTILQPDHLGFAIAALATCDLYTGLPCYLPGKNVWSSLVAQFVNDNSVLTYLPLAALMPPMTINGMYYVMRTETLRRYGGFAPIAAMLSDDYALARHVRDQGGIIRQGTALLSLRTTVPDAARYFGLMHRWNVFALFQVFDQPLTRQPLLAVLLGTPPVFFWIGILLSPISVWAAGMTALALALRQAIHAWLRQRIKSANAASNSIATNAVLSIASELLQPLHMVHAAVRKKLVWRNRKIQLNRDGTFSYLRQ